MIPPPPILGARRDAAPDEGTANGRLLPGTTVAKLAGMRFLLTPGWVTRRVPTGLVAATTLAGAMLVGSVVVNAAQQAIFRSATQYVPVLTTVIDAQGRLVPDLDRSQFTILDN